MEILDIKKNTETINSINPIDPNYISCYCYYHYVEQKHTFIYNFLNLMKIDLFFERISKISKNTTHIICEYDLNKKIHIPSDTTHLIFDDCFNKNVIISNKITHITFGILYGYVNTYNSRLHFSYKNTRPIFSQNITYITFKEHFNKKLIIPQNVTHLNLLSTKQYKIPHNITHLNVIKCRYIPKYIKHFRFIYLKNKTLPQNITHLYLNINFNQKIKIPQNVTHLYIGYHLNIKIIIPNNVTHLYNHNYLHKKTYVPKHIKLMNELIK